MSANGTASRQERQDDSRSGRPRTAAQVMRTATGAVHPEDTLARAAEHMAALGVREVPVAVEGRLAGILSQSDLLPHRGHFEWTQVQDVMTTDVVVVPPEAPVSRLARLLLDRGINAVPVVAETRVLGMVSRAELLQALATAVEGEASSGGGNGSGGLDHVNVPGHGSRQQGPRRITRGYDRSPSPG